MRHLLFTLFLFFSSGALAMDIISDREAMDRSLDFVRQVDLRCTLTDGYQCADIEEDKFLTPQSWQRLQPGIYLAVWPVVYEDFLSLADLSAEQKDLRHYKIGFTEDEDHYIVAILGLALPLIDQQGNPVGVSNVVFGRSVKYWVDKRSRQIVKKLFYK